MAKSWVAAARLIPTNGEERVPDNQITRCHHINALCKTNVQSDSPCWRGVYKIKEKTTRRFPRFVGDKLAKEGTSKEVDRAKPETLPHRQNTWYGIFFLWRLAGLLLLPFCESARRAGKLMGELDCLCSLLFADCYWLETQLFSTGSCLLRMATLKSLVGGTTTIISQPALTMYLQCTMYGSPTGHRLPTLPRLYLSNTDIRIYGYGPEDWVGGIKNGLCLARIRPD
jgi:hypothetical protein